MVPVILKLKYILAFHVFKYFKVCFSKCLSFNTVPARKRKDICGMAKPISEVSLSSTELSEKSNEEYAKAVTNRLQSPIESHFAVTPTVESITGSPANGFTTVEGGQLLCEELDNLSMTESRTTFRSKESIACSDDLVPLNSTSTSIEDLNKKESCQSKESICDDMVRVDSTPPTVHDLKLEGGGKLSSLNDLLSPAEESISMFTQLSDKLTEMSTAEGDSGVDTAHNASDEENCRPEVCYKMLLTRLSTKKL